MGISLRKHPQMRASGPLQYYTPYAAQLRKLHPRALGHACMHLSWGYGAFASCHLSPICRLDYICNVADFRVSECGVQAVAGALPGLPLYLIRFGFWSVVCDAYGSGYFILLGPFAVSFSLAKLSMELGVKYGHTTTPAAAILVITSGGGEGVARSDVV